VRRERSSAAVPSAAASTAPAARPTHGGVPESSPPERWATGLVVGSAATDSVPAAVEVGGEGDVLALGGAEVAEGVGEAGSSLVRREPPAGFDARVVAAP
jgi:hypothetical protein